MTATTLVAELANASRDGVYRLGRFSIHTPATHAGPHGTLLFSTCYDDDFRSFYAPGDATVREAALCIDAFEQGFKRGLEPAPYSEVLRRQATESQILSAVYRAFVNEADCTVRIERGDERYTSAVALAEDIAERLAEVFLKAALAHRLATDDPTEPAKLRDADKRRETFLAVQAVAIQNPNVHSLLDSLGLAQLLNVQSPGV